MQSVEFYRPRSLASQSLVLFPLRAIRRRAVSVVYLVRPSGKLAVCGQVGA